MQIYYAPSSGGFYAESLHADIPVDAVPIIQDEHRALLDAQAQGLIIASGEDGRPMAVGPAPLDLQGARAKALGLLAERRWRAETNGITINGIAVATDRESQALISGAWIGAQIDPAQMVNWKGANGWMTLDAEAITAVGLAVRNHVQGCFDLEMAKAAEIEALETVEAVDAWLAMELETGWPA